MSKYEDLKNICRNANSVERLKILQHELRKPMHLLKGIAPILKQIDPYALNGLPENISPETLSRLIDGVIDSANGLEEILRVMSELQN